LQLRLNLIIIMKSEMKKFKEYLKSGGLSFTTERRQILEGVFSIDGHFDVDELYDRLRKRRMRISRATIYRSIPLLIESGMIKEALRCQKNVRYEHVFGHEHHDHMVCLRCGKVIEFKEDRIEKLQDEVCRRYDFESMDHRLGIRGYCKKCQSKMRKK
jgi:Fur family ferric uptake transcriptional regulator